MFGFPESHGGELSAKNSPVSRKNRHHRFLAASTLAVFRGCAADCSLAELQCDLSHTSDDVCVGCAVVHCIARHACVESSRGSINTGTPRSVHLAVGSCSRVRTRQLRRQQHGVFAPSRAREARRFSSTACSVIVSIGRRPRVMVGVVRVCTNRSSFSMPTAKYHMRTTVESERAE